MNKQEWFNKIVPCIVLVANERGYKYPSAIIAQAILESAWGQSGLAKYNNFFGLKCGSVWRGKSVNMATKEEYTAGTLTSIRDNFRVYDSMLEGVRGYFDFIATTRYSNLKGATSSRNYLELIKQDGYATSSKYVDNVYKVVENYNLLQYDVSRDTYDPELDKALTLIAEYVINGYFGNGEERKQRIVTAVQSKVNEILKG